MHVTPLPVKDAFFRMILKDERPIYGLPTKAKEVKTREPQQSFTFYDHLKDMKAILTYNAKSPYST